MVGPEIGESPASESKLYYGYIVVIAAFFISLGMHGLHYAFGVFFNPMLTEFGWTRAATSGAFSITRIMQGLLAVVMGRITDKFGPRLAETICGLLLGLGFLLTAQTNTLWQLYLFYGVIMGAGMGGAYVPLMTTVARWFTRRRSMMTGIVLAGIGIGSLITPLVANQLISSYGWRISYTILGSIILVIIVLAAQFLKRDPTKVRQIAYGKNESEEQRLKFSTQAFSLREAVLTRQFWLVFAMLSCFAYNLFAVMVHITPHATELGISAANAANILATFGGVSILGKIILGSIGDRVGSRQTYIISFILMLVTLLWLVPAREAWMLYLGAAIFGFAYGGCATAGSPLVAELFGLGSHGLILGVVNLGFSVAAAAGPLISGYVFDVTGSYQMAFVICAGVSIVGLVLSIILRSTKQTG